MILDFVVLFLVLVASIALDVRCVIAQSADLILHHGKIVTVDSKFSIAEAVAIKDGRILRVGRREEILRLKTAQTRLVDLAGKTVLPGLIDSHVHPADACLIEFDHPIPEMETIQDVLDYVKSRAAVSKEGEWIQVRQVFITRLREQRYPTRDELDRVAPKHPVVFATGPDASLNSLALKLSGMDRNFQVTDGGPGYVEKDPDSGEPTGIIRSCTRFIKARPNSRQPNDEDKKQRLLELFEDYASVGITSIGDRDASEDEIQRYRELHRDGKLKTRVSLSHHIETIGALEAVEESIRKVAGDPLVKGDDWLKIIGIKTYLDGGMLTGSAYMREPWGVSKLYSITDPKYRGVLFIPRERLLPIVKTTLESGLQFTAHSQGDGAVRALLDVYEELDKARPVRQNRPCITHASFMSLEAVLKLAKLGVVVDVQPAWLYLDTRTLAGHFGYDRLRFFQPLRSLFKARAIAGGGSDHMQKIGSMRSVNPYNPFLGMWVTVTRKAKNYDGTLHPEEALTREQAIRFYTANNSYLLFREKQTGSIESGKLADLIVLDTDILKCPVNEIRNTRVLQTYIAGKLVFERK
ncbi:MAG: amidohydrolase family protein [Acidobacteria bacterium]|nr:amidohydrolase family protein [Acidobacteriota bacterium]MCI0623368.1 amidohydrolase family protein [Acidobacteriota bacterium]MCI0721605.1 amidohydrolase family protein [Acidobacteriota bacterium]